MRNLTTNLKLFWCLPTVIFAALVISCSSAKVQRTLTQIEDVKGTAVTEDDGSSRFKKALGLVDGEYEATNDPQGVCPLGALIVRAVADEYAILIGAELIVSKAKLGLNESSYSESGCQIVLVVKQQGNKITSKKTQTCKKQVYNFSTTLTVKGDEILYSVENSQNGKKNLNVSCRLERQK